MLEGEQQNLEKFGEAYVCYVEVFPGPTFSLGLYVCSRAKGERDDSRNILVPSWSIQPGYDPGPDISHNLSTIFDL